MIRATFDTNVYLSGFPSPFSTPGILIERWLLGAFEMAVSQYIIDETTRGYERPYFAARTTASKRVTDIDALRSMAMHFAPDPAVVGVCRDPKDDAILGTAVAANADYLVTGDADLLALGSYGNVRITTPRDFLAVLDATAGEPEGEEQPV